MRVQRNRILATRQNKKLLLKKERKKQKIKQKFKFYLEYNFRSLEVIVE